MEAQEIVRGLEQTGDGNGLLSAASDRRHLW